MLEKLATLTWEPIPPGTVKLKGEKTDAAKLLLWWRAVLWFF